MTELEQLCRGCGRCCNGRIFTGTQMDDGSTLPQPCPHHRGGGCDIYASRPAACRAFLCRTAEALVKGEKTLQQAAQELPG